MCRWFDEIRRTAAAAVPLDAARAVCSADLRPIGAGVQPRGGLVLACLKEHRDPVPPACKQYVVTDDPKFNPSGRVNGEGGRLQLVRPQP